MSVDMSMMRPVDMDSSAEESMSVDTEESSCSRKKVTRALPLAEVPTEAAASVETL